MNQVMEKLIDIFADVIKSNNFITFAYSKLDDKWYYLCLKYEDTYDCVEPVSDPWIAYDKMLEEAQHHWMKEHQLTHPDLSLKECIAALPPDIRTLLDAFTDPYEKAALKILTRYQRYGKLS